MTLTFKPGEFILNDIRSSTIHVHIQDRPDIPMPKRRVSFVSPLSYDGELVYDDDGYEPTEFDLKCFYDGRVHGDNPRSLSTARNEITRFFNYGKGEWIKFVPYFDQDHNYLIIATEITFENKYYYDGCISFTVKIKCQPYKYLDTTTLTVGHNGTVTNTQLYTAKPLVNFTNVHGDLDIQIGDITMKFRSLVQTDNVYIDCENYAVYTISGKVIRNMNDRTIGKDFFELPPSKVSKVLIRRPTGNDPIPSSIKITPNWRVLV